MAGRKICRLVFAGETKVSYPVSLNPMKRPFQVIVIGWLFIAVGLLSLAYHLIKNPFDRWAFPIVLIGITAIVGGIFLLRGRGWARWLILAWLAFHVAVSALNSLSISMAHFVLMIAVGYSLLMPPTSKYFKPAP